MTTRTRKPYDSPTVPNDACGHERAEHWHGTYTCYVGDGCRCEDCRAASRAYLKRHRKRDRSEPETVVQRVDGSWREQAACIGRDDLFFRDAGDTYEEARAICQGCPVRRECLEFVLTLNLNQVVGIWAGHGRTELLRRKAAA